MPQPSVAAELVRHSTSYYTEASDKLVRHLRDMADRVERTLRPQDGPSMAGTPRYSHAVEQALEAMAWDLANAHAAHLAGAAARADSAEAQVRHEAEVARAEKAAEGPHDCTSCGTGIDACDDKVLANGKACCSQCSTVDTHGDTDPQGLQDRLVARGLRADVSKVAK